MAFSFGRRLITNGLALYLDAANTRSYPGTGTTWTDISGQGNNGTLTNGPVYSGTNGGTIVFDGNNDRVTLSNFVTISSTSDWTIQSWISSNQTNINAAYIQFLGENTLGGRNYFSFEWNNRIIGVNSTGGTFAFQTGISPRLPSDLSFFLLTMIGRNGVLEIYSNLTKTTANATLSGDLSFVSIMVANGNHNPGGRLSTFSVYNRALSETEIIQNYRALGSRFGL